MTRPRIEPRSPGPSANTLPIRPMIIVLCLKSKILWWYWGILLILKWTFLLNIILNTNKLHTIIWFQAFQSNTNLHTIWSILSKYYNDHHHHHHQQQLNASPKSRYWMSLHQETKWWKRISPTRINLQNNHYRIKKILRHYNRLHATVGKYIWEAKEKIFNK